MSLATTLEYVDHERDSMRPDESLDFLIQLRDAIERRIEVITRIQHVDRAREILSASPKPSTSNQE